MGIFGFENTYVYHLATLGQWPVFNIMSLAVGVTFARTGELGPQE
jgi:hypothetical protein